MISSSLYISVTGSVPATGSVPYWIKMTTDPPEETSSISKEELYNFLDAAYGVTDHCTGAKSPGAFDPTDASDTTEKRLQDALSGERCADSALALNLPSKCSTARRLGVPISETVYVHWSDKKTMAAQYKFNATSDISPDGPRRSRQTIQVTIDFTDADYAPINRYADNDDIALLWLDNPPQWIGNVLVGKTPTDRDTIGVGWNNGQITLTQAVSGRLTFSLPIQFDAWTVSIPGIIVGDKRNYTATAYAFHPLLDKPAEVLLSDEQENPEEGSDCNLCGGTDLAIPGDSDTGIGSNGRECQRRIDWEERNVCTGYVVNSGTIYEVSGCPNTRVVRTRWVKTGTPDSARISAEEYEEDCCKAALKGGCIPDCKEFVGPYAGGAPIVPSEQYWRDRFRGQLVIFVRIRPEDGCGLRRDKFEPQGCCTGVLPIVYNNTSSPDIIADNSQATVYFDGGLLPYEVSVDGEGFYLDAAGTITSAEFNTREVTIHTSDSCGTCEITAGDSCGNSDSGKIRSTAGVWELYDTAGVGNGLGVVDEERGVERSIEDWRSAAIGDCDSVAHLIVRSKAAAKTTAPAADPGDEQCGPEKYEDFKFVCGG